MNPMKFLATLALAFALANTGNAGHVNLPLVDLMSHARFTDFKAMLAAGADPNEADDGSSGARPLHFAVSANVMYVEALLAAGADVDATNEYGFTPLHAHPRGLHAIDEETFPGAHTGSG